MPVFKIKNCNEYFGDLMKNLGKKIFTVFIVLLFCLSPLGAIDLNQGDNSSHLNDLNDGSHLNDLNGTDIEIKSINETDESIKGNDVESQKLSINDSNSSKSLSKKNVNIVMEVDDTTYGEAAVVKIWFKSSGFGTYYSPKVVVEDRYTHEVYTKDYFTKGYNEIKLRKDLDPSTYTVTFEYRGSSAWYPKTVTDTFTVNKKNPNLKASVEDVYVGENPVVKVSTNEDVWGEGWTHSPQFTKGYYTPFCRGEANCTIDEDLPAGNYTCTVSYAGDFIYANEDLTVNFAVNKRDPNLTVQVDDVIENDPFTVKVRADESLNGEVTYLIKSRGGDPIPITRSVKIVDGVANSTLETHLNPGTYSVSAYFDGDDYFEESTALASFYVNEKPSPGLSASIDDIELGEKPVVKVSSNDDLEDDVIISSPQFSKDYTVNVQGGSGSCIIDEDLAGGNYSCNVKYPGDIKYRSENITVNFAVNKHDPNLVVHAYDIFMGKRILVQLNANESINGEVEYYILPYSESGSVVIDPDMRHNATLVNGVGTDLVETDLAPGKYEIFATYKGDDSFREVTVSSEFDVTGESNNLLNVCKDVLFNG